MDYVFKAIILIGTYYISSLFASHLLEIFISIINVGKLIRFIIHSTILFIAMILVLWFIHRASSFSWLINQNCINESLKLSVFDTSYFFLHTILISLLSIIIRNIEQKFKIPDSCSSSLPFIGMISIPFTLWIRNTIFC